MIGNAIEARGIRKSFGSQRVLDGINLSVPAGTVFALLGPNGAGKTTLINILSTLVSPDGGTASVMGHDVVRERENVKRSISLTGQYAAIDEVLTGRENLQMMARLAGLGPAAARRRTAELLARFDLADAADQRAKGYSGGMRRRLDLAVSLIVTPPVIFLDEPTTGLDTRSRQALWDVVRALAADGVTILLTTQYLEEADELADRVAVINHGVVVAEGTAAQLKAEVGGEVVELRDAAEEIIREIPTDGGIDGLRRALDLLAAEAPEGASVSIRKPSMDDVFLAVTEQSAGATGANILEVTHS